MKRQKRLTQQGCIALIKIITWEQSGSTRALIKPQEFFSTAIYYTWKQIIKEREFRRFVNHWGSSFSVHHVCQSCFLGKGICLDVSKY